ncbi:MAG TPA: type IV pilus secretin PilQ [Steroidobacteraceae bacterium]|nr:type IV pilus secretin PilQ [Steroidobacteraceae bacterium]
MTRLNPLNRIQSAFATLLTALIVGSTLLSPARAADSNSLQAIDVRPLAGQQMQLTLKLSGPAPQPTSFAIDNPARVAVDLANTSLALTSRRIDVRSGGLDSILAAQSGDRSRLELVLDKMMPYAMRVDGNNIIITLGAAGAASASAQANATPAASDGAAPTTIGTRSIQSIDFRRSVDGAGRVVVRLSDPHTPINLRQVGDQVVVDFVGTELPKSLMRRFDANDYGTSVTGFDATRSGGDARLIINAKGDYEQLAYQTNDQYVVEIQPRRKPDVAQEEKRQYTGEKMSIVFQDLDTRAVLQLVADTSGQNIVVSDSVHGGMTLRLQNVPWDQVLDIVLRTKGLDKRQDGNVIIVAPADEIAAREKAELAAKKDMQELEPLRSEFMQVNYAKASDMAALIKSPGRSLLSPRGTVSVDARTNTLLVQDSSDRLEDVRRLVATLDIPVRQVRIEARLVIVNNDFQRELGAVLGFNGVNKNGANGLVTTSGSAAGVNTIVGSALTNLTGTGSPFPVTLPTGGAAPTRYNVNLPVSSPAGSIALGVLGSDYLLDLELSAAQTETRADIISSPSVITANQKQATIIQGTEIPYQQSASSGATSIEFKPAVLSLEVTPQITPDNRIILDVDVKKDVVGTIVVASGGVNVPSIDTQEITTQVLVSDGQTVVLGGILQTTHRVDETKVPYLGDVPILGNLFKTTTKTNDKDELLIFVTPKIVHEGVNVY